MKTILVGLDGSTRAEGVVRAALELARAFGGKLHLVRVVGIPVEFVETAVFAGVNLQAELVRAAYSDLTKQAAAVPAELLGGMEVEVGTPWDGICRVAKAKHADCIVIGSHGYGGLDRLLGTTAGKVANHATCSVYIARPTDGK